MLVDLVDGTVQIILSSSQEPLTIRSRLDRLLLPHARCSWHPARPRSRWLADPENVRRGTAFITKKEPWIRCNKNGFPLSSPCCAGAFLAKADAKVDTPRCSLVTP